MNYMCLQIDFSKCDDILIYMRYGIPSPNNERLAIICTCPEANFLHMAVSSPAQGCHLLPTYTVPSVMKLKCHLLLGNKMA